MTRRRLRPDEIEVWQKVAQTTHRLHPEPMPELDIQPMPIMTSTQEAFIAEFEIGMRAKTPARRHDLVPGLPERIAKSPIKMDQKAYGRLKRGKLLPEGKIDLHGMTMAQAHPKLTGFIMRAHGDGKRLVLVITGKGRQSNDDGPIPVRRGVLRHQVPQWLSLAPLAPLVLQVSEAHIKHGGGGAYYVYLRRTK